MLRLFLFLLLSGQDNEDMLGLFTIRLWIKEALTTIPSVTAAQLNQQQIGRISKALKKGKPKQLLLRFSKRIN